MARICCLGAEEEKALSALNTYYSSSIEGDIDTYLGVQDPLFLEELSNEGEIDLKEFYESALGSVTMTDYSISDAEVVMRGDSALIYYRLKGAFRIEDGEKGKIDNDMVAFLWRYDDWKVRWTITRTLYEQKIAMTYLMDAVVERTFEDLNEDPIRDEMIAEGFAIDIENYEMDSAKGGPGSVGATIFKVVLFVLIIGAIIAFMLLRKR